MRRSLAPSQNHFSNKRILFKSPLLESNKKARQCREKNKDIKEIPIKLSITEHEQLILKLLSKPFKIPIENYVPDCFSTRTLGIKRATIRRALHDPNACNALVLYTPQEISHHDKLKMDNNKILVHVVVDPSLGNILRPHQREGVKFMYDCVMGNKGDNHGCIMADEMGLGKTLQCITLLWTLLRQSSECKPSINKVIIVCPSSLVKNWYKEFNKWLENRISVLAIDNVSKELTIKNLEQFMANQGQRCSAPVLVISYETFRIYANILNGSEIGMVLCDEGHRLKNCENLTYKSLMGLQTKKRVLLSGTPIQNDLLEYYSLINFVNPGLLGTQQEFHRNYETIILRGQDSNSTVEERDKANDKLAELKDIVNKYMIRRTSNLLNKYLPIKFEMIICIKMSPLQILLYKNFINNDFIKKNLISNEKHLTVLKNITTLKKLCSHPNLIYDKIIEKTDGFENAYNILPSNYSIKELQPEHGTKIMLLDVMLANIKMTTDDKIVIVSNYTQTLDLLEKLFRRRQYTYVRLDGTMSIKKRGKIVDDFNKIDSNIFIFILSSKAGGCGLNLIGANRLIMFDPDWNPANDDQAMARVWRDGQKKPCYIYRMLATGSIEEKIFQRQTHKKALSNTVIDNNDDGERHFTQDDLRDLFKYDETTISDTHAVFKCKRCVNNIQTQLPPKESDCTSDLSQWYHCSNNRGLPDTILSHSWEQMKCVSFVFHHCSNNAQTTVITQQAEDMQTKKTKTKKLYDDEEYDENDLKSDNDDDDDPDFIY